MAHPPLLAYYNYDYLHNWADTANCTSNECCICGIKMTTVATTTKFGLREYRTGYMIGASSEEAMIEFIEAYKLVSLKAPMNYVNTAALYDIPSPITHYTTICDNDYADLVPMYEITRTINVGWWGLELRQRHSKKAIK